MGIGAFDPLEFCDQGRLVPLDRFRSAGAFGQETGGVIRVVDHLLAGGAARSKDGQKPVPGQVPRRTSTCVTTSCESPERRLKWWTRPSAEARGPRDSLRSKRAGIRIHDLRPSPLVVRTLTADKFIKRSWSLRYSVSSDVLIRRNPCSFLDNSRASWLHKATPSRFNQVACRAGVSARCGAQPGDRLRAWRRCAFRVSALREKTSCDQAAGTASQDLLRLSSPRLRPRPALLRA